MLDLSISSTTAIWFLPFAIPISIWVAYVDMKCMKIPNKATLALLGVFFVVGLIVLPLTEFPWRLLHLVVVLVIGFILNIVRMIGAGDAKFAAVVAAFVPFGDLAIMVYVFSGIIVIAFITHRLFMRIPAVRKLTPDWESWDNIDFPMGLALGGTLVTYLALGTVYGQ